MHYCTIGVNNNFCFLHVGYICKTSPNRIIFLWKCSSIFANVIVRLWFRKKQSFITGRRRWKVNYFFINKFRTLTKRGWYSYTKIHFTESEKQTTFSMEPNDEKWNEIEPRITDIFVNDTELDVQSMPFDAASDTPFEEQKLVF